MNRAPIDLNIESPIDLANRMIAGHALLTQYTPNQVLEINADFVVDMINENDDVEWLIDWEFFFFYAKREEMVHLMEKLYATYKDAEPVKHVQPEKKIEIIQMAQLNDEIKKKLKS